MMSETDYERFQREHPWLLRWEGFKLTISEWWHAPFLCKLALHDWRIEKMTYEDEAEYFRQRACLPDRFADCFRCGYRRKVTT
jgi:hypothetical protein